MNLNAYLDVAKAKDLAESLQVPPPLLSQWRTKARKVPAERCPDIEVATNGAVKCEDLRPDLADQWAYLRGTEKKEAA